MIQCTAAYVFIVMHANCSRKLTSKSFMPLFWSKGASLVFPVDEMENVEYANIVCVHASLSLTLLVRL